jgi:hypothetical protein
MKAEQPAKKRSIPIKWEDRSEAAGSSAAC